MKVLLLLLVSAVFQCQATAEWVTWTSGADNSMAEYLDGLRVLTLRSIGVTVSVKPFRTSRTALAAEIYVINETTGSFNVFPDQCGLEISANRDGQAPLMLISTPPASIAAAVRRDARIHAALMVWAANSATSTQTSKTQLSGTVVGGSSIATINGAATTTITGPDWQARRIAERRTLQLAAATEDRVQSITNVAMKANTIRPGGSTGGIIWWPS